MASFTHTFPPRVEVSPTCLLNGASCARSCSCRGSLSALRILAKIYNEHSPPTPDIDLPRTKTKPEIKVEPSPTPSPSPVNLGNQSLAAEADASLIQATLSILFGLLMNDSPLNQAEILNTMDTPGSDRAKLGRLVEQAKEFVAFYDAMNGRKAETEGEDGSAGEVVKILERLRDRC